VDFDEELIVSVFFDKKEKIGARTIKMLVERNYGFIFNLKKIRRIMKKYSLVPCLRRRKHKNYFFKNTEHKIAPNRLKQKFKVSRSGKVYSTDITYLPFSNGNKAYLSAVKDLGSKEVVQHTLSKSMDIGLVVNGLSEYLEKLPEQKRMKLVIHSDQGGHYTSHYFRRLLKKNKVKQSMSRRGNCLDNAPIESFFGHLKDELDYKECKSFSELKIKVDKYIDYYNNERPQWGLNGKTPVECRGLN
jgi:transposase InsO family protein